MFAFEGNEMMRPLPAIMVAALLSACVPTASTTSSASIGPGDEPVDALFAGIMFGDVCVDTLPDFAGAPAALEGYRQNTATGTYYHPNLDLSVKLTPDNGGTCSMVFSSRADAVEIAISVLAAAGADGPENALGLDPITGAGSTVAKGGAVVQFLPAGRNGGRQYYRAFVTRGRG
jgi:hypothetical protein